MLFSEGADSNIWVGITGGVTGLAGAIVLVYQGIAKVRADNKKAQVIDREAIIDRQEKQILRYENLAEEQQQVMDRLRYLHSVARQEIAEIRGYLILQHDYAVRLHGQLVKRGVDADPPPDIPPPKGDGIEADFLMRTVQQNLRLVSDKKGDPGTTPKQT